MAKVKCKNFGSCSFADSGKEFDVAAGADDRCPECGVALVPVQGTDSPKVGSGTGKALPLAGAVLAVVLLVGGGYRWWSSQQVVALKPEATASQEVTPAPAVTTPASAAASLGQAAAADSATPATPSARQPELNVGEAPARMTCDEATLAKRPDAERICRRAAAVTLLNSGAQAAVAGRLEQAEKDYASAKDKDPDIPELYFNLAVLKARQNKGSEAVDNLTLSFSKGFTRRDLVTAESAFRGLKSDPALKARLDALLAPK